MTAPWPLPAAAHVPGQTPRPAEGSVVYAAAEAAPAPTDPAAWAANGTYLYGIALYQAGFFWEAHEVWEPVWMHAAPNSRARALMQGLIQLANACLKLRMARPKAAARLIDLALGHLVEAGTAPLMGLEPAALLEHGAQFRAACAGDGASDVLLRGRPVLAVDMHYNSD